jgi:hypothetical protein
VEIFSMKGVYMEKSSFNDLICKIGNFVGSVIVEAPPNWTDKDFLFEGVVALGVGGLVVAVLMLKFILC